jgi:RNA polymerase sigma-70 factor (ECF subfamily)
VDKQTDAFAQQAAAAGDYKQIDALAARAVSGDKAALEALCNAKARTILYHARKSLRHKEDAEDAAQEIVLKMCAGIETLRDAKSFNAWLQRIITNTLAEFGRKRSARPAHDNIVDFEDKLAERRVEYLPHESSEHDFQRSQILKAIDALPEKQRRTLLLYCFDQMSYAEIAEALGVTTATVGTNILHAREAIKKALERVETAIKSTKEKDMIINESSIMAVLPTILHEDANAIVSASDLKLLAATTKKAVGSATQSAGAGQGSNFISSAAKLFGVLAVVTVVSVAGILTWYEEPAHVTAADPIEQEQPADALPEPEVQTSVVFLPPTEAEAGVYVAPATAPAEEAGKSKPTAAPKYDLQIEMLSDYCECGHGNPLSAILTGQDAKGEITWAIYGGESTKKIDTPDPATEEETPPIEENIITDPASSKTLEKDKEAKSLYSGKGTTVIEELRSLHAQKAWGDYKLIFTVRRADGTKITATRDFVILKV